MSKQIIGQQGEVRIIKIDAIPAKIKTKPAERVARGHIISHSEQGHHHVVTGGDGCDGTDISGAGHGHSLLVENLHQLGARLVHAALERHGVAPGGDALQAILDELTRQHGGCGGAVTRGVVGLARHL